jgi:hypothetical protein
MGKFLLDLLKSLATLLVSTLLTLSLYMLMTFLLVPGSSAGVPIFSLTCLYIVAWQAIPIFIGARNTFFNCEPSSLFTAMHLITSNMTTLVCLALFSQVGDAILFAMPPITLPVFLLWEAVRHAFNKDNTPKPSEQHIEKTQAHNKPLDPDLQAPKVAAVQEVKVEQPATGDKEAIKEESSCCFSFFRSTPKTTEETDYSKDPLLATVQLTNPSL